MTDPEETFLRFDEQPNYNRKISNWLLCIDAITTEINGIPKWIVCAGSIHGDIYVWCGDIDKRRNTLTITKKAKKDWKMMEQIAYKVIQARCQNVDSEKLSICKDVLAQLFINCRPDQVFYSQKSDES